MSKKYAIALVWVASLVLTAGATYYGSARYQRYTRINEMAARTGMSADQINEMGNADNQNGARFGRGGGAAGDGGPMGVNRSLSGKVDAVEDGYVTITTPRGSEKIVIGEKVAVSKTAPATVKDIEAGRRIIVEGTRNSKGEYEATTIIRVE